MWLSKVVMCFAVISMASATACAPQSPATVPVLSRTAKQVLSAKRSNIKVLFADGTLEEYSNARVRIYRVGQKRMVELAAGASAITVPARSIGRINFSARSITAGFAEAAIYRLLRSQCR